jgi:hypothetical protein
MIIFKKVRAKNFLSVGNQFLDYDLNNEHLTCVKGNNGSGKCLSYLAKIRLHNKVTGEVIETTIGEFYEARVDERNKRE